MKKINLYLLISIVALFLIYPSFSEAQRRGKKRTKGTSTKTNTAKKSTAVAKPQRTSTSIGKRDEKLSSDDFSVKELTNEEIFTNIYTGDFLNIPFDRDSMDFNILYGGYLTTYARACDSALPKNKVEMTRQECETERVVRNGFGTVISRNCVRWRTVGTGLYADPQMYDAKLEIDRIQARDALRNGLNMLMGKDPLANAMNMVGKARAMASDLNSVVQMNACTSPATKRFQENLRLFALNKQPIKLGGKEAKSSIVKSQPGVPFKDQDYTKLLEDLVSEQSRTWAMNRYSSGSMSGVSILSRDDQGRPSKIKGQYIYTGFNGRSRGSVTVTFTDGLPECLYFFDFPSICRSANRKIVASYANGSYQNNN